MPTPTPTPTPSPSPQTVFINQATAAGANAAVANMLWSLRVSALTPTTAPGTTTLTVTAVDQFFNDLFARSSLI